MSAPLILAMPSKGRLQQNAESFFARSGLELVKPRGPRDYRGAIAGFDGVEVAYLSAAEITTQLALGAVHLGVTGEDLVREMIADADREVVFIDQLGFGYANVAVAVPQAWIDVRSMADLDDVATAFRLKHNRKMRLATKYANLTRGFFAEHGIVDYLIVESLGATEAAPAAGTAELIVDITTTGATLTANGLKVIDDGIILRSQANLVAARAASWDAARREIARLLLDRRFQIFRVQVQPRGRHNHLALAAQKTQLARRLGLRQIACGEPLIGTRMQRPCRPGSMRNGRPAHQHFAIRPQLYLASGKWLADGSPGHVEGMVECDQRRGLCHAVALHHNQANRIPEILKRSGERAASGDQRPEL